MDVFFKQFIAVTRYLKIYINTEDFCQNFVRKFNGPKSVNVRTFFRLKVLISLKKKSSI